jgi:teichuronic acid exporter
MIKINQLNKLSKGTLFYSIRQIIVTIIQFGTSLLILKWLDPVSYGNYTIITLVIGASQILAEGGFSVYLIQRKEEINNKDLSEIVSFQFLVYLTIQIAFILALFFFRSHANIFQLFVYLNATLIVIPIAILRSSYYVWLEKKLDFDKIAKVEVLEVFLFSISSIFFAFLKFGVWTFILSSIIKTLVGYLYIRTQTSWKYNLIIPKLTKQIRHAITFGISYHTPTIVNYIRISANPIIIGPLLGMAAVGIADRAIFFAGIPLFFIGTIQQKILFPYFSSIQDSKSKVKDNFESIYYASSICDKIFYIPLIILGPNFIILYYKGWENSIPLFYIAVIGNLVFGSLSFSTFPVLNGIGKSKVIAILSFFSVTISWLFLSHLVEQFGLTGYALLGLIIWIVGFFPSIYLLRKYIPNVTITKQMFLPILAFIFSFGIFKLALESFCINMYFTFFASILTMLIYIIVVLLLDFKSISNLFKRLTRAEI